MILLATPLAAPRPDAKQPDPVRESEQRLSHGPRPPPLGAGCLDALLPALLAALSRVTPALLESRVRRSAAAVASAIQAPLRRHLAGACVSQPDPLTARLP